MLEVGGGFDFLHEPVGAEDGGEFGSEDFDGDLAVVFQILREIDGGHAAFAEASLDPVAVGEGGRESIGTFSHGARVISTEPALFWLCCRSRLPVVYDCGGNVASVAHDYSW